MEQGVSEHGRGCSQMEEDQESQAHGDGLHILLFV